MKSNLVKIVFVHLFNDRSGSPKVLRQVIDCLHQSNCNRIVITSKHSDGFLSDLDCPKIKSFYKRSENKFLTFFFYIVGQILLFIRCLKLCRQNVVFYINTMMPFGAALAGKIMRKTVLFHIHETSVRPLFFKKFLRLIINLTADRIVYVSDFLKNTEGFEKKKQITIYNALDEAFVNYALSFKPKARTPGKFVILMVCSLKKYKGVFEFFAIAKRFTNERDFSFCLVLNAEKEEIGALINPGDVPANCNIFSRQKNVAKFYLESDLLVNLSRPDEWVETFGLTILEGMAFGLPVIVPPVGGPTEIVRNGVEGYQISSYNIDKIVQKIKELNQNFDEYHRLSKNAKERVKFFNLNSFEKSIRKLGNEIL